MSRGGGGIGGGPEGGGGGGGKGGKGGREGGGGRRKRRGRGGGGKRTPSISDVIWAGFFRHIFHGSTSLFLKMNCENLISTGKVSQ